MYINIISNSYNKTKSIIIYMYTRQYIYVCILIEKLCNFKNLVSTQILNLIKWHIARLSLQEGFSIFFSYPRIIIFKKNKLFNLKNSIY